MGRALVREALTALLALTLFVFNFGQASVTLAAVDGHGAYTQTVYCGGPAGDDQAAHPVACHACRPDLPVLAPPPDEAVAIRFEAAPVVYAGSGDGWRAAAPSTLAFQPRGPPAAI